MSACSMALETIPQHAEMKLRRLHGEVTDGHPLHRYPVPDVNVRSDVSLFRSHVPGNGEEGAS
jgi:hypothetical protein